MEHPFSVKELVSIGLDLVVGLDVLHKHKVIHRFVFSYLLNNNNRIYNELTPPPPPLFLLIGI